MIKKKALLRQKASYRFQRELLRHRVKVFVVRSNRAGKDDALLLQKVVAKRSDFVQVFDGRVKPG